MKHIILLISLFMSMAAVSSARQQIGEPTLKDGMEFLHRTYGINFVYDSSLDILQQYSGKPLHEVSKAAKGNPDALEICLKALFKDSGIEYEIMRKYVVLTKAGSRKKPKDYTIFIEEQHDTINESVITATTDPKRNSTQTGLKRIDSRQLNSGFALFSTPDVVKTLQMLPGVSSGTELLSGLYVHGGNGSDNLFLLDGVPINQSSHLLGLFSSFNSDVISSMDFYKTGFPARYGSKLSSIVDITTKEGDFNEYHGLFAIGLLDGRLQVEVPLWKDRTSFNIGLRRTWTEIVTVPLFACLNKIDAPDRINGRYAFTDLNAKITHRFSDRNVLSANFYTGRDVFSYLTDYESWYRNSYESDELNWRREVTDAGLSWGNTTGSLNWKYDIDDNISMSGILYYSGSFSGFDFKEEEYETSSHSTEGQFYGSDVHNIGLKSDFHHLYGSMHRLRYGASAQLHLYRPSYASTSETATDGSTQKYTPYSDRLRYNSGEASLYAEDEIALNDAFSVNAGLRYSLFFTKGRTWYSLEPRLAMKYSFNDKLTAKASYTEMSQQAHLMSSMYIDPPTNMWLPSTSSVRPSRSREVAAGLYSSLSPTIHLNVEGWYKHMYHILEYAGAYSVFPPLSDWESSYRAGQGRSWGAELDFGYSNGRTDVNVYYTLSWSQRKFDDFYRGWYKDRNDNRHKLTLMARHKFGKRFEIYGAWNYHSGNRVTMASHESPDGTDMYLEPNNVKLPDYHRLDIGMNFVKNTKRGNTSIWNLSLYNAYCRTNPLTSSEERKSLDGTTLSIYGMSLGIIPIIPTFSYTLKF